MDSAQVRLAVGSAKAIAAELGLEVEGAVILQNSNRLTIRLLPCDVLARVAPVANRANAAFEVEVVRRLETTSSPVAGLEPRVEPRAYVHGEFVVTFWTYYEPVLPGEFSPEEYGSALERLHVGMRGIDIMAPHFTDRVAEAQGIVANAELSPELGDADREFLGDALGRLRAATVQRVGAEQLLHGEPHPGNVLRTAEGLLFIDFETCCRGPAEFDVAHAPEEAADHYPVGDGEVLGLCRSLVLAMVAAWRWDRADEFPNGREMGIELLGQLREAMGRPSRWPDKTE